eukprot:COSAG01_NODE_5669_length_4105_cov_18.145922_4_plen_173_part_00
MPIASDCTLSTRSCTKSTISQDRRARRRRAPRPQPPNAELSLSSPAPRPLSEMWRNLLQAAVALCAHTLATSPDPASHGAAHRRSSTWWQRRRRGRRWRRALRATMLLSPTSQALSIGACRHHMSKTRASPSIIVLGRLCIGGRQWAGGHTHAAAAAAAGPGAAAAVMDAVA